MKKERRIRGKNENNRVTQHASKHDTSQEFSEKECRKEQGFNLYFRREISFLINCSSDVYKQ